MQAEHSKIEDIALQVLRNRQREDYGLMDKQMNMQKDEIIRDLSFARLALKVPEDHYELLTMAFPLLQCTDAVEKTKEWKRVTKMDICRPYLVNKKQRSL